MRMLTLVAIRAPLIRTKTVNRIPQSREPLSKCLIQVNRSCGLTIVRSLSTTKRPRNCRSKPRGNLLNHQRPTRGNVEGNNPRPISWTSPAGLYRVGLLASYHPCFHSRTVFLSTPIASPMTHHAQPRPHLNHHLQFRTLAFFTCFLPRRA
jgi:hypothetical protein